MPRKKLIRKQPLLGKIRSYPFDLLLSLNEQRLSVDWNDHIPHCLPIGTFLSLVFLVLCKVRNYYVASNERRDNSVFLSDYSTYRSVMARAINGIDSQPPAPSKIETDTFANAILWVVNFINITMALISFVNTFYVAMIPYRNYALLSRSKDLPKPKGSKVSKQNVTNATSRGILQQIYSYFEDSSYYETDGDSDGDTTYETDFIEKDVWVMSVWDPPHFNLFAAASFAPLVLFSLWLFASKVSFWALSTFAICSNSISVHLVSRFLQLISDKQIIYQETFNEYNKKYVIPKTSVLKKNAIIDATLGPFVEPQDIVHDDLLGHLQNDLAFVTHDINGRAIKDVRATIVDDYPSRPVSPSKQTLRQRGQFLSPSRKSRQVPSTRSTQDKYSYYDDSTDRRSLLTSSTPFTHRNNTNGYSQRSDTFSRPNDSYSRGYDSFSRSSRVNSPLKSPSRISHNPNLSYSQRIQLSPDRSSRPSSPQRSPSPSKRVWH